MITTKEYPPPKTIHEKLPAKGLSTIFGDFVNMPKTMKQLGLVQFFSLFALFSMWVFTTPAIATHIYHVPVTDNSSATYQDAANWVNVMFAVYNGTSMLYAFLLPFIAKKLGRKAIQRTFRNCDRWNTRYRSSNRP